jgi:hypothetical protein
MYSTLITELKEFKDLKRKKRRTKLETKDQQSADWNYEISCLR